MKNTHQIPSKVNTLIGYQHIGAGQPLLFVHGTTADHHSWSQVSPLLEESFSIYAMDRRGRGLSRNSSEYTLMREVEDVVAVVEAIGEPVSLIGHSFGGL